MQFKRILQTNNKTSGKNTDEFIIIHHTATGMGSIKGVLKTLTIGPVSVHYVIDTNGDIYSIGKDADILWHAGVSKWGDRSDINRFSIGIEVIGPLSSGPINGFTFDQKSKVKELVRYLMGMYKIPKENVLRHSDITQLGDFSSKKILWDGKHPTRKVDIDSRFLNDSNGKPKYNSWEEWQASL